MTYITRFFAVAVLALWPLLAAAQDGAPDYDEWQINASAAETTIDNGSASNVALERLRERMVEFREQFLAAQETNAARIATLENQLDALGPVPEGDEAEPEDIAARRAELNNQLSELRAPGLRAEEAYLRANGIIAEIDQIIRERQTTELLALGPSPLNPANWPPALSALMTSVQNSLEELASNAASPDYRAEAQRNLPLILLLTAVGLMLILRGKRWAIAGVGLLRGDARRGSGVFRFLLSLGQILLPYIGIFALVEAASASGMMGPRWELLLGQLQLWAALLLGAHWLADQTFHERDDVATVPLPPKFRRRGRRLVSTLALLYVIKEVIDTLGELDGYSEASSAVVEFPLLLASGLLLTRLGRLRLRALPKDQAADPVPDARQFRQRLARVLSQAGIVIGIVGPVMAAVGYFRVGEALVYPFMATLALIGAILVLQRFINDLHRMITNSLDTEPEGLMPVLAGFVLAVGALPVVALIWGARVADLREIWVQFREGFVFGETRISPTDFLVVLIVFVLGYMLTRLLQGAMKSSILPKTKIDQGGQTALVSGLGYIGIFTAAIVAITAGGLDLSSLAIVAGALSVGIGFGLQTIVSNFVSGIILLIERPISEGDWIEVNGTHGIVKDISVRATRIETFNRNDLIVPNADLVSGTVANYTRGNSLGRIIVRVGVAYREDTRRVEKILLNIARDHPMVLMNPAPYVYFAGFGADSLDFEIRAILRDVLQTPFVETEMRHQIAEAFREEGIEIPFAQRDIWLRNPETLVGQSGGSGAAFAATERPRQQETRHRIDALEPDDDAGDGDGPGGER